MRCPGKVNWLVLVCAAVLLGAGCAQQPPRGAGEPSPDASAAEAGPVSKVVYPVRDILDRLPPWEALVASPVRGCKPTPLKRMKIPQWMLMYTVATALPEGAGGNEREDESFGDERGNITIDGDRLVVTHTARVHAQVADLLARMRAGFAAMDGKPGAIVGFAEDAASAAVRQRLRERIDVEFRDIIVEQALESLGRRCGLAIVIDPRMRERLKGTNDDLARCKATLLMRGAPLGSVLEALLWPHAQYDVQGGAIRVRDIGPDPSDPSATGVYPMADVTDALLRFYLPPGAATKDADAGYRLKAGECALHLLAPESAAHRSYISGLMIVTGPPEAHEEIAWQLGQLRRALAARDAMPPRGGPPAPGQPVIDLSDPETAALWPLMKEKARLRVKDLPLSDALAALASARPGLNFAAWYDLDLTQTRVSVDAEAGVETILSAMFAGKFCCAARRGYFLVSERGQEAPEPETYECLYPVADLLPGPATGKDVGEIPGPDGTFRVSVGWADDVQHGLPRVVERMARAVSNRDDPEVADWQSGRANAAHLGGILRVSQSRRGHEKVAEFLTQLRRERLAGRK
ncbi:MAG: hypothetical protein NTX87_15355 [Planctomycetota bacterium]|nr:hypothetical protein [Planctomycetota bacterium]